MFLVWILSGATPLKKNKEKPNGGVRKLVCRFNDMRIPSHNGSAPFAINIGPTNGTMTKIISI